MLHPVNTSPTFICQTYQNDEQSQQMLVCVCGGELVFYAEAASKAKKQVPYAEK